MNTTSIRLPSRFRPLQTMLLSCGVAFLSTGSVLRATTDISTLTPPLTLSAGTDTAWTISADTTSAGLTVSRTAPGQNISFSGSTGSEVLTLSGTVATNSYYSGNFLWGKMSVLASSGLTVQSGFNNIVLQTGLNWSASSSGTMTVSQAGNDGTSLYAQGNDVLASTMNLSLTKGNDMALLVINGGTTQTIGALTSASDTGIHVAAYSGSNGMHGGNSPSGTNVLGSTSAATLRIGNNNNSGSFGGVIGTGVGDTSVAAASLNIVKLGTGTQTFTGANVYTGSTTVSGGTLALSGTGSITGSTVYSIAAGATFDTSALTTPGYSLAAVATTLGVGATTNGFINVGTGALTLGNSLTLNFTALPTAGSFNLYDSASVSGDFSSISITGLLGSGSLTLGSGVWTGTVGGYDLTLTESTGTLTTAVSAVPEPSTYAAILGTLSLGVVVLRRRARKA